MTTVDRLFCARNNRNHKRHATCHTHHHRSKESVATLQHCIHHNTPLSQDRNQPHQFTLIDEKMSYYYSGDAGIDAIATHTALMSLFLFVIMVIKCIECCGCQQRQDQMSFADRYKASYQKYSPGRAYANDMHHTTNNDISNQLPLTTAAATTKNNHREKDIV